MLRDSHLQVNGNKYNPLRIDKVFNVIKHPQGNAGKILSGSNINSGLCEKLHAEHGRIELYDASR